MNDYNEYKLQQLRNMLTAETSEDAGGYGAHLDHWSGRAKQINLDADALRVLINFYESCADRCETKSFKLHTYDLQMIVIALIYYETEMQHSKYRTPDPEEIERIDRLQDLINDLNKMVRGDHDWTLDITAKN